MKPEKIFIGVSWPYANGNIHLGHLAGQNIVADVFGRYHRLKGNKVLQVSGSDSHGAPVVFKAEDLGITPSQMAEESHQTIVDTYEKLGLIYENYTKTTTDLHKEVAQNIFLVLKKYGYLNVQESKQYFDEKVQRFLPDRYVKGTCPVCGATNARGDECPECGEFLEPERLINPYSTLSDSTPVLKSTEHFYMDLTALQDRLDIWIKGNSSHWRKWVREFSLGWIRQGLEPRPVTRDMEFGVKVPVEGWDKKVLYVWIEAVVGYLSASIEWADKYGDSSEWEDFWKDDEAKHYYFIAGGNVPFHTIMWPGEIIAYNSKYNESELEKELMLPGEKSNKPLKLPFDVPANSMLTHGGKKMSKGDGTGLTVEKVLEQYSADALRFFFVRYAPESQDREYLWKDFIESNNNELVANIGNFINRTLTFINTRFDGVVPEGKIEPKVEEAIDLAFESVGGFIESTQFIKSTDALLQFGSFANKYFNDEQPWEKIKSNPTAAANSLYNCIQLISAFSVLLKPFTPFAVDHLEQLIGVSGRFDPNKVVEKDHRIDSNDVNWLFTPISSGTKIAEPKILFPKYEYSKELEAQDNVKHETEKPGIDLESFELQIDGELSDLPIISKVFTEINVKKLNIDQKKEFDVMVENLKAELKSDSSEIDRIHEEYIKLHDNYSSEKGLQSSSQFLKEKLINENTFFKINNLVDIYNYISIKYGLTIGVHDASLVKGKPSLKVLEIDTEFQEIGSGNSGKALKGEYAYVDESGILCRLDIKQCQRTRISNKTENALVIIQGNELIGLDRLQSAMDELERLLIKFEVINEKK